MATTHIQLEQLEVQAHVGVPLRERRRRQRIILDIDCDLGSPPILRDEIQGTLNYVALYKDIHALVATSSFVLIETLAEAIAHVCLRDRRVVSVTVRIRKPKKLPGCAAVGVVRSFHRSEVL